MRVLTTWYQILVRVPESSNFRKRLLNRRVSWLCSSTREYLVYRHHTVHSFAPKAQVAITEISSSCVRSASQRSKSE